jgi:hypothetical protein
MQSTVAGSYGRWTPTCGQEQVCLFVVALYASRVLTLTEICLNKKKRKMLQFLSCILRVLLHNESMYFSTLADPQICSPCILTWCGGYVVRDIVP